MCAEHARVISTVPTRGTFASQSNKQRRRCLFHAADSHSKCVQLTQTLHCFTVEATTLNTRCLALETTRMHLLLCKHIAAVTNGDAPTTQSIA